MRRIPISSRTRMNPNMRPLASRKPINHPIIQLDEKVQQPLASQREKAR